MVEQLKFVSSEDIRARKQVDADRVAELMWKNGLLTRITRPSKKQAKDHSISFFAHLEVAGQDVRVPVIVRRSTETLDLYRRENEPYVTKENPILVLANERKPDKNILTSVREELSKLKKKIRSEHKQAKLETISA